MTDKKTFETTITWFSTDKFLPPDNYEPILIYFEMKSECPEFSIEYSHICEGFMNEDRKINIKLPDTEIWGNDIDDPKIIIKYWAYLPELPELD